MLCVGKCDRQERKGQKKVWNILTIIDHFSNYFFTGFNVG